MSLFAHTHMHAAGTYVHTYICLQESLLSKDFLSSMYSSDPFQTRMSTYVYVHVYAHVYVHIYVSKPNQW
jgi:hypothetical protein